jgi:hypothetical protein
MEVGGYVTPLIDGVMTLAETASSRPLRASVRARY